MTGLKAAPLDKHEHFRVKSLLEDLLGLCNLIFCLLIKCFLVLLLSEIPLGENLPAVVLQIQKYALRKH